MTYVVLSSQNGRDTSVPSVAVLLVTGDPVAALNAARMGGRDARSFPFVEMVIIYEQDLDRYYPIWHASNLSKEQPKTVVYVSHPRINGREVDYNERFYEGFGKKCGEPDKADTVLEY